MRLVERGVGFFGSVEGGVVYWGEIGVGGERRYIEDDRIIESYDQTGLG